ncbi:MAG: hypothetical protein HY291_21930 [Planctomycetes bacterium]|nr:hypothetical protein [Planctomycetota bacterium]
MVRISGNLSRKTPLPGVPYSSLQVGATMELELAGTAKPAAIQRKLRKLYTLLDGCIQEQLSVLAKQPAHDHDRQETISSEGAAHSLPENSSPPVTAVRNGNGNGHGTRRIAPATNAQLRAIRALCKDLGLEPEPFLAEQGVTEAAPLSIVGASKAIDDLKSRLAACGTHP